jgi:hypothetical protein
VWSLEQRIKALSLLCTEDNKKDIIVDEFYSKVIQKAFEMYGTASFSMDQVRNKIKEDYVLLLMIRQSFPFYSNQ